MLKWLRGLFSKSAEDQQSPQPAGPSETGTAPDKEHAPLRIDQLIVEPDESEDFDAEACRRLLATIAESDVTTVEDVHNNVVVSLESFFTGNDCKHSIAANVTPPPPYHTAQSWYALLKGIRARRDVDEVVVAISMIEPYEDGRLGNWPYADTLWVESPLDRDTIAELLAPLQPDEVVDASRDDPQSNLTPPFPPHGEGRVYWVWWD